MIEARDLVVGYGRRPAVEVLESSFQAAAGCVVGLIGRNGAGKTSLIRTVLGFLPPLRGTVTLFGMMPREFVRRHCIGYVPEVVELPAEATANSLLRFAVRAAGRKAALTRDDDLVSRLLGEEIDRDAPIGTLSKGTQQRVAIAMALTPVAGVVLLDEPEAGLDPGQRIAFRAAIREYATRASCPVLLSSHDIGLISIADTVLLARDGRTEVVDRATATDPARVGALFA